ncbi:MAG TPA: hypothetical protein VIA10_06710 [Gaiellaceae bacterium]|jgi:hypothetical protein
MDPDLFITIAFGSLVALFAIAGAAVIQHERGRGGSAAFRGSHEPLTRQAVAEGHERRDRRGLI